MMLMKSFQVSILFPLKRKNSFNQFFHINFNGRTRYNLIDRFSKCNYIYVKAYTTGSTSSSLYQLNLIEDNNEHNIIKNKSAIKNDTSFRISPPKSILNIKVEPLSNDCYGLKINEKWIKIPSEYYANDEKEEEIKCNNIKYNNSNNPNHSDNDDDNDYHDKTSEYNPNSVLSIPSYELAQLVSLEWNTSQLNQKNWHLSRPITFVLFNGISYGGDNNQRDRFFSSRQLKERELCIQRLLEYINTDTLCFWDPDPWSTMTTNATKISMMNLSSSTSSVEMKSFPSNRIYEEVNINVSANSTSLRRQQEKIWKPFIDIFEKSFDCVEASHKVKINVTDFSPIVHSPFLLKSIENYLHSLNGFQLAALELIIRNLKSVILGMNLFSNRISMDEAIYAATLELQYQTEKWGMIEEFHELELSRFAESCSLAMLIFHTCSKSHSSI